jgi:hypothetical protein
VIQRLIAVSLGALVTYLALILLDPRTGDANSEYLTAVVIGALVSFFWPIAIGFWLGRRAKERREDQISAEVERQLAEERARQATPRGG